MAIVIKTNRRGYKSAYLDGKRLPSPSSICSRFKDSGGLIHWANAQGLEGNTLDDARDVATTPGSIVHDRIECDIRGREFDERSWSGRLVADHLDVADVWTKVERSWSAYRDWREMVTLCPVSAEVSLASERHKFFGTLDAAMVSNRLTLVDWKTGALYPDHLLQLGGYTILWEENFPDREIASLGLLSINKEHGGFTWSVWPRDVFQVAVDQFIVLREAYDRDKALKKLL